LQAAAVRRGGSGPTGRPGGPVALEMSSTDGGASRAASPPAARGAAPWPPAARVAVGCGLECALLVLLEAAVLWGLIALTFRAPGFTGVAIAARAPPVVIAGRPFRLAITVRNESPDPITVGSIAAPEETLREFALGDPEPRARRGPLRAFGGTAWAFQKEIAPGESWTVRYRARTRRAGTHEGALQVQIGWLPRPAAFTVTAEARGDSHPPRREGEATAPSSR